MNLSKSQIKRISKALKSQNTYDEKEAARIVRQMFEDCYQSYDYFRALPSTWSSSMEQAAELYPPLLKALSELLDEFGG